MPQICRLGDTGHGTCTATDHDHSATGTIITGAGKSLTEGSNMARVSDIIISDCHDYVGRIISGSGTVIIEGNQAARVGDYFDGKFYGTLIVGANTVFAGG